MTTAFLRKVCKAQELRASLETTGTVGRLAVCRFPCSEMIERQELLLLRTGFPSTPDYSTLLTPIIRVAAGFETRIVNRPAIYFQFGPDDVLGQAGQNGHN